MLVGLGTDLVELAQIAATTDLAVPEVFLTANEAAAVAAAPNPVARLAAAFAAKEAFFKALAVQEGFHWTDVELLHDGAGRPRLGLHGPLAQRFAEQGLQAWVSLSHAAGLVTAVVALEAR